jgi:hypothetical protein
MQLVVALAFGEIETEGIGCVRVVYALGYLRADIVTASEPGLSAGLVCNSLHDESGAGVRGSHSVEGIYGVYRDICFVQRVDGLLPGWIQFQSLALWLPHWAVHLCGIEAARDPVHALTPRQQGKMFGQGLQRKPDDFRGVLHDQRHDGRRRACGLRKCRRVQMGRHIIPHTLHEQFAIGRIVLKENDT